MTLRAYTGAATRSTDSKETLSRSSPKLFAHSRRHKSARKRAVLGIPRRYSVLIGWSLR
jgi:hypothetical protein